MTFISQYVSFHIVTVLDSVSIRTE